MKTITTSAIVALMTATLALSAAAPAFAQQTQPPGQTQLNKGPGGNFRHSEQGGNRARGDLLSLERGAEAVEIALVRLSHAVELTAEQQPLFDAFKTAAIAAATDLESSRDALRPTPPAEGETATAPDFSERLENRIAIENARLAALEAIQPSATAFFDSLSDAQKAALTPQRPDRAGGPGFGPGGPRHQGQHQGQQRPAVPAEAPAANG